MKNQSNEMLTLEWLLPLFNQQLLQVSDGWQLDSYPDFEFIRQHYHDLSGALTMANLPHLSMLANRLSLLAITASSDTLLKANHYREGQFAHQLLQHELTQYAHTGSYRRALIDRTINNLTQILSQISAVKDYGIISKDTSAIDGCSAPAKKINVVIPSVLATSDLTLPPLNAEQYKQLSSVWRQQVHQLLTIDNNDSTILLNLKKVSHYLWQATSLKQTADADSQQRLWLLTELWLTNLADNSLPLPSLYAPLLSELDWILEGRYQQATTTNEHSETELAKAAPDVMEDLIADIYIQVSGLENINIQTQGTLSHLSKTAEYTLRFLPRILAEIETIILGLDNPHTLILPLQRLERQLECRGWSRYVSQVNQVLIDVKDSTMSESVFAEKQWLIERQLQELYSDISNTEHSIHTKIGEAASFTTISIPSDSPSNKESAIPSATFTDDNLRQLRIAVEDVKGHFNDYVQQQQTSLLPTKATFAAIGNAFDDMGLPSIRQVSDKLGEVFVKLEAYKIKNISWNLIQSLAESVTALELLLDHLAQQIFDRGLLQQAHERIEQAHTLIDELVVAPEAASDFYIHNKPVSSVDIRYDDSGKIAPITGMSDSMAVNDNNLVTDMSTELDAFTADSLIQPHNLEIPAVLEPFIGKAMQLPTDAQDSDPEIKEIFIEEAEEVLADITPKYEHWRLTPADLTELKEIRRGFHTLKGSGRMVGAYYTGELAWSIEDMLNRILDRSITASTDIIQLIADVLAAYPDLVQTFAHNNENHNADYSSMVPLWVACANAYSKQHGNEFSYDTLRKGWLAVDAPLDASINDDNQTDSSDATDDILETIYSINEMMADIPVIVLPKSTEEQALCQIFIEEAEALLREIKDFVSGHSSDDYIEVTDEIVRAFHTLRAASGSSTLTAISDISAIIEHSLEQLQKYDTPMTAKHLQVLAKSLAFIEGYLNTYEQSLSDESVQNKEDLASLQAMLNETDVAPNLTSNELSIAQLLETDIDGLLNAEWELDEALNNGSIEETQAYIHQQIEHIEKLAHQTKDSSKFTLLLAALGSAYSYLDSNPVVANDKEVQRVLHAGHHQLIGLFDALAGSMSLKVDKQVLSNLHMINVINANSRATGSNVKAVIDNEVAVAVNNESTSTVQSTQAEKLKLEAIDTDIELLEIFLEEAQELDSAIAQSFNKWRADVTNTAMLKVLQRHLHTIKGGARMAGIRSIGDLTHEVESIYEAFVEERLYPTVQWLAIMQIVQDTLSLQIDYVVRYQEAFFAEELIEQLQQFERRDQLPKAITLVLPALQIHRNNEAIGTDDSHKNTELDFNISSLDNIIKASWADGLPDLDILEVFLEEADEIITSSNKYLQLFLSNISDVAALQALQRELHTIKGGARMVTANGIADIAHEMETVYEELAIRRRPATKMVSQLLTVCHDWLADAIFVLKEQVNPPTPTALILALQQFSKNPDDLKLIPNASLQAQRSKILAAKMREQTGKVVENLDKMPPMSGNFAEQEQSTANNEMIRISGGVIEHMINLSGESAINRARIDMGMSSLTNSIEEMGTTVQRLADQLRRMEIELEAQILSQIDDAELINNEDFDPLEMDQYSSLNQLSKSLTESASDLIDINSTLLEKTRDSENLLLQLSRTQTELQDGLMSSRMVPFTRVTPRLERIVRQTANELNKSVELTIINADDEIDRTILERITSPLEHMLRNAVDHGIETTQNRLTAGKDRSGHITLEVLREGSEVVINLTDDGHGIDVAAVRDKAIAQGLIDPNDDSLTDLDVIQYIFSAGLTTTQHVTQISGRGVGMDVVISEIRQLGGMVSVASEGGQGSRFTIRLPLTVAVSDALVVRAADRYYAIPLVQIERVIRISPEKIYDYYESGVATLHIEDEDYRVRYLNEILSGSKLNELMVSTNTSLPLIIIKNRAGQKLALQVDQIAGSRIEIVVKPLGRQLSHLAGISAATIMGDGSVMLILDLIALMRNAPAQNTTRSTKLERHSTEAQITVLVVDDSVTVRKVTSRLLERQGINVAVAKDGVDAIEILQETIPDLILLDIEMPRMDGFEVATQVRHSKRLRHIPIIMITSRTGEKHRERALEIGVNDYMGKPFQESELLDRMQILLGQKISLSHDV